MGSFGNYLELELLDHVFGCGGRNYTPPAALYVALSTADPTDSGGSISEPSGNNYARVSTASGDWNVASNGSVSNANTISFPQASASWGTITHFAIYDAASGGNMLMHAALTSSRSVSSGDTPQFVAGDLIAYLD